MFRKYKGGYKVKRKDVKTVDDLKIFLAQEIKAPPKNEVQIQGTENVAST